MVERFYRNWVSPKARHRFDVVVDQTDLAVTCSQPLRGAARQAVVEAREQVLSAIAKQREFGTSLEPVEVPEDFPPLARAMAEAARCWSVGPMAAVAGAIAEYVGRRLAREADHVVVENGGDAFVISSEPLCFALYAGSASPFADRVTFTVRPNAGLGVCTSSGRVGPSLSFGQADAVVAVSPSAAFADAAATSLANRIRAAGDVGPLVESERRSGALSGLIACCAEKLGAFGDVELGSR